MRETWAYFRTRTAAHDAQVRLGQQFRCVGPEMVEPRNGRPWRVIILITLTLDRRINPRAWSTIIGAVNMFDGEIHDTEN